MGRGFTNDILTLGVLAVGGYLIYTKTDWFQQAAGVLKDFVSEIKGGVSTGGGGAPTGGLTPTGSGTDKNGVKLLYPSSQITYNYRLNENDGMRYDFTGLPMDRYLSCELTGYFTGSGSDEVSGKLGGGSHNDSNPKDGRVYDLGVDMKSGATRMRVETSHPNYSGNLASGSKGCPLSSSTPIGYKFIKLANPPTSVTLEIWQDCTNNNAWKKIFSYTDTKYKFFTPVSTHQETLRLDGLTPKESKLSLSEIAGNKATSSYTSGQYSTSLFTYNRPLPLAYNLLNVR